MSREIYVKVFEADHCNYSLPGKLTEVIDWFREHLLAIPEQYRDEAECEIEVNNSWDEPVAQLTIKIGYRRPETDQEREDRLNQKASRRDASANAEIERAIAILARHGVKLEVKR